MKLKIRKIGTWFRNNWVWLLIIALIAAGIGWWLWSRSNAARSEVRFEKPSRQNIERTIEAAGIVQAEQVARMRFLAGGKVTYVGVKEGDSVRRGQTIAVIDRAALQKQLQQNLNSYERERYDWEGFNEDLNNNAQNSDTEREKKKNQLNLNDTVLSVEIQDIAIRNTVLSSPFAGIVTLAPTSVPGVQLMPSDYFEVVNPDSVVFLARIDEADIAKIVPGQSAVIQLDAYLDAPIESQVKSIGFNSVEAGSGTQFEVKFPISYVAGQLRLGMNGDVTIKLGRSENALTIPLLATRTRGGNTYVDIKNAQGDLEEREIETGIETDDRVEVVSGLSENDEIAVPE